MPTARFFDTITPYKDCGTGVATGVAWDGTTFNLSWPNDATHGRNVYGPGTWFPFAMTKEKFYELYLRVKEIELTTGQVGAEITCITDLGLPTNAELYVDDCTAVDVQNPDAVGDDEKDFVCLEAADRYAAAQGFGTDTDGFWPPSEAAVQIDYDAGFSWFTTIPTSIPTLTNNFNTVLISDEGNYYPNFTIYVQVVAIGTTDNGGNTTNHGWTMFYSSVKAVDNPTLYEQEPSITATFVCGGTTYNIPLWRRWYPGEEVDDPDDFITITHTATTLAFGVKSYWAYDPGDGGGAIWDSSTGAKLRDSPP